MSEKIYLKYFQKHQNIGDQLSYLLIKSIFEDFEIIKETEQPLIKNNILFIGSILEWCDPFSHVCGAGLISSRSRIALKPLAIHSVRGPLTAHFLRLQGIKAPNLFGDPGIAAPKLFKNQMKTLRNVGIIPHYVDLDSAWVKRQRDEGYQIINPLSSAKNFFEQLQQCEVILSSSLHGIIFAHAYKKSALWIELSDRVIGNGFKFFDYYLSLNISPENVSRHKISQNDKPEIIAQKATTADHTLLLEMLNESLYSLKKAINKEQ